MNRYFKLELLLINIHAVYFSENMENKHKQRVASRNLINWSFFSWHMTPMGLANRLREQGAMVEMAKDGPSSPWPRPRARWCKPRVRESLIRGYVYVCISLYLWIFSMKMYVCLWEYLTYMVCTIQNRKGSFGWSESKRDAWEMEERK